MPVPACLSQTWSVPSIPLAFLLSPFLLLLLRELHVDGWSPGLPCCPWDNPAPALLYKQVLSARRPQSKEGKPTSSGPERGELSREAASQAPGPVLLTFSHPTPPRSCLHFRPEAVGSAKRLELALLERCRTPTPLAPHHPFKSHQRGVCSKDFSHCPPPSPPKGHHSCEYTPVQGALSQSLPASVSLHATSTQHCHGWEHQKALWTLPAAKDKAPEPNISGGHLLNPLPSEHQPALLPSPDPNSTATLRTKSHGQDTLTPLNKSQTRIH